MTPQKPSVTLATVASLDIRICHIESAEPILKSPKKPHGDDTDVTVRRMAFLVAEEKFIALIPEHGEPIIFDRSEVTFSFHGSRKPYEIIPTGEA